MSVRKKLAFSAFVAYAGFGAMFGSCFSFLLIAMGIGLILYYKNQPPNEKNADEVLQTHKISIIAHRGGAIDAPENTLAAIKQAKLNGADGVELDLEFTADDVAVILHDETVDRTTDGMGFVREMTFEEVSQLDASIYHDLGSKFPKEKIPTFEEAIALSLELDLKIYIDVKGDADKATDAILKMYHKYPQLYQSAIVCSFWPMVAYKVRQADPDIVVGLTHRHYHSVYTADGELKDVCKDTVSFWKNLITDFIVGWSMKHWLWYYIGSSAYLANVADISKEEVNYYEDLGISVVVWTPNNRYEKDFIAKTLGCSYITDTLKN